jgi:hypothetical protein
MGINWTYRSGYVTTLPTASYKAFNEPIEVRFGESPQAIDYINDRNNYRMPAYHRMDLSLTNTKKKKWGERTWNLSIYNAYNRMNPYFVNVVQSEPYFTSQEQKNQARSFQQAALFPILPSFSYGFKF